MKKLSVFLTIIFLFFILISKVTLVPKIVWAEVVQYARITNSSAYFYSAMIDSPLSAMFLLENSYFVKLLEKEQNGFHKAEYLGQQGYVKKADIVYVSGTPQNPYPINISFRVFSLSGLNIRSNPSQSESSSNILGTIPFLENNLIYLGKISGEEMIKYKGNIWYYCIYNNGEREITGYVYSVFCDLLTSIFPNLEELQQIDTPIFEQVVETGGTLDALTKLPQYVQIIIISVVSLPCIAIIYLLFKPTKISIDNGKKKRKIRRLKNSDFYEIED